MLKKNRLEKLVSPVILTPPHLSRLFHLLDPEKNSHQLIGSSHVLSTEEYSQI